MKNRTPFTVVTWLCLYFVIDVLAYVLAMVANALFGDCGSVLGFFCLTGYCFRPTWPLMSLLGIATASLIGLWIQKNRSKGETILATLYSVTVGLEIAYVILWHATGQEWDWL